MNKKGIERNFIRWIAYPPWMNVKNTVLIKWRDAFMSAAGVAPSYFFDTTSNGLKQTPHDPQSREATHIERRIADSDDRGQ